MGFSTSGAVVLLFIAGLVAAGVVVPTFFSITASTGDAFASQSDQIRDQANTGIQLDSAEKHTVVEDETNTTTVALEATNTGTETLDLSDTYVILDGTLIEPEELETGVDGNNETRLWGPGSTANFETEADADSRAKIVTEGAIADASSISDAGDE